jgi:hypothetical protein
MGHFLPLPNLRPQPRQRLRPLILHRHLASLSRNRIRPRVRLLRRIRSLLLLFHGRRERLRLARLYDRLFVR